MSSAVVQGGVATPLVKRRNVPQRHDAARLEELHVPVAQFHRAGVALEPPGVGDGSRLGGARVPGMIEEKNKYLINNKTTL